MLLVQPISIYTKSGNSAIDINVSGISFYDDDKFMQLSANGIILPEGSFNYVLTSNGTTINIDNYAT